MHLIGAKLPDCRECQSRQSGRDRQRLVCLAPLIALPLDRDLDAGLYANHHAGQLFLDLL
jgi:hypothetical protein